MARGRSNERFLMGTFAVDVVDYLKAMRWLERRGIELGGRNSVLAMAVGVLARRMEAEVPEAEEPSIESAFAQIDERFPVLNYKGNKRLSSKAKQREFAKVLGEMSEEVKGVGERRDEREEKIQGGGVSGPNLQEIADEVLKEFMANIDEEMKLWKENEEAREKDISFNLWKDWRVSLKFWERTGDSRKDSLVEFWKNRKEMEEKYGK